MAETRTFFGLSYLLTWVLLAPWFFLLNFVFHGSAPWWFWLWTPLAFIGGWGPTVAALILTARAEGRPGVRRLLRALVNWRAPLPWYLFSLLLPPAATAVSIFLVDRNPATWQRFAIGDVVRHLPIAYALALPFGPLGEELGWRGYALPRLLGRIGPIGAALVIGVMWTFWHAPMMLFMPGASIPDFMGLTPFSVAVYLGQITAWSVIITLIYVRTKGNILLAVFAHLAFNTAASVVLAGLPKFTPDGIRQIYLTNVAVLWVVGLGCMFWLGRSSTRAALSNNGLQRTALSAVSEAGD
jgi:membrane protease YdiL (CAAX protease family)